MMSIASPVEIFYIGLGAGAIGTALGFYLSRAIGERDLWWGVRGLFGG